MSYLDKISKILVIIVFGAVYFPLSAIAQSGDAVIDGWLSGAQYSTGNSSPPSATGGLNPVNHVNGVDKCNSSGAISGENNCPNDLLYTPNAYTGGYQSFGVGIKNYPDGYYAYPVCYLSWYYNGEGYSLGIYCNYYVFQVPAHTYGVAAARVRFGNSTTSSPWGSKPMSTLAFKGNNIYTPYDYSVECFPFITGVSAPCNNSVEDAISVDDVGYEDKLIIDDSLCSLPYRSGGASDANYGCFVRDGNQWISDLPAAYPDTTASDAGGQYVAAMGSADSTQITEGYTYFWYLNFYQWQWESQIPHNVVHNSAITTHISLAPGCSPSAQWNCFFNVDQTSIAPGAVFP